jgi:hypothetical protein
MAGTQFHDVSLSHTSADKDVVEAIARRKEGNGSMHALPVE